jgi:hypothetical protein
MAKTRASFLLPCSLSNALNGFDIFLKISQTPAVRRLVAIIHAGILPLILLYFFFFLTPNQMSLNLKQMELSGFEPDPDLKWEKIGKIPAPDGVDQARYTGSFVSSVAIDEHRVLAIDQPYYDSIWESWESFVRLFDTRTRKWSNEAWPSVNQPRSNFGCVLCNGKIYVIGGLSSDEECLNLIECLDLSVSPRRWRTMDQRLETARYNCKCVAIGKQIW